MALYTLSGVSVESWVEIAPKTAVRLEVDEPNRTATLFFGERSDFVLHLTGEAVRDVAALSNEAATKLGAR
jgi:hypothetical protein